MMEANSLPVNPEAEVEEEEEEEFVLLDLDAVSDEVDIPPNAPYVLSGLDTLNPVMVIGDNLKLIGKYEETIGTCLVFSEDAVPPTFHEESGPSEKNLFSGKCIIDPNQPAKQLKSVARLHKILRFAIISEAENQDKIDDKNQGDTRTHTITDLQ